MAAEAEWSPMIECGVGCLVEMSEARAYARLITGVSKDISEQFGLAVERVGSAYALVAGGFSESLILNRVIGLGVCEPATSDTLAAVEAIYRARGVTTYAVEIGPASTPAALPEKLRSSGFFPFKLRTMLYRRIEVIESPACEFRVACVGLEQAAAFVDLCCTTFQFAEPIPSLLRTTFAYAEWQHWMAFEGEKPVAAAITHVEDEVAWFGWVGTLLEYRGRGAQSAITAAQLRAAKASGCKWVTLETVTGTPKRPSQSLRNYRRLGWTVAYDRIVYVHRSEKRV